MNKITKRKLDLPIKLEDLKKFILVTQEAVGLYRAKLKAVNKLNMAQSVRQQTLEDGQRVGTALLYAEARLGELLEPLTEKHETTSRSGRSSLPQGITHKQSHYAQQIARNPEIIEQAISEAENREDIPTKYDILKRIRKKELGEKSTKMKELPKGKFRVIYADPPWQYRNTGFDQSASQKYPTLSTEEICKLPIQEKVGDSGVLFLWITNPLLPEAFKVMEAWGFEYKTNFVWVKRTHVGIGWFQKSKHEILLTATKGEGMHPREKFDSWFEAKVIQHSRKPDFAYEMIERMYERPYLELFARRKRVDWEVWGNEV